MRFAQISVRHPNITTPDHHLKPSYLRVRARAPLTRREVMRMRWTQARRKPWLRVRRNQLIRSRRNQRVLGTRQEPMPVLCSRRKNLMLLILFRTCLFRIRTSRSCS